MGRNGGSNNSSVTGRTVSWQKSKRIKARVTKKRAGAKEKHKEVVKGVSGARTKKHQKKVERRQRLSAKETAALEAAMDIEIAPSAAKKKNTKGKKEKADATAMQE